ncbi:MAG TPA: glutamine amidotransferase [Solirubrobacteraceae bacterium]|nr:glutamine amidotransferase [Solirubrobacteraceae bacterium]
MILRVCAIYPDLMNIYADRGNLLMLERRCAWRGIEWRLHESSLGAPLRDEHDLYYIGGGQDADQRRCAGDLLEHKASALHAAAARGAVVLGVCGGYQLLGHSYQLGAETIPGIGLLDLHTVRSDGPRLIGNVALQSPDGVIAGFENHAGRTHLAPGQAPLGRVLRGHGNDGHSGLEGARTANVIGTYVHGPLLPKNSWLCDWLTALALGVEPAALAPLEDALERAAHASALRAAGVSTR